MGRSLVICSQSTSSANPFHPSGCGLGGSTYAEPVDVVGVGGEAGATSELLLTSGSDHDGVLHRAEAAGVKRAHVEDVDTLHLYENLETLQTSGLLEVGGDGSGLGTGAEKVVLGLDLCWQLLVSDVLFTMTRPRLWGIAERRQSGLGIVATYPSESCRSRPWSG